MVPGSILSDSTLILGAGIIPTCELLLLVVVIGVTFWIICVPPPAFSVLRSSPSNWSDASICAACMKRLAARLSKTSSGAAGVP
ncbi:uncharacterized protein METZ01_LOCUS458865 [marine metagenome]|uniref:Uncharacterized protein n=1 Tax=marine metagenome TaxID=408172 RepID=A0A383AEH7_9ZZZZ